MSQKQDSQGNYMDGVRVKISEKYKPPPKINLAMTYAQRLTLNKQLQDNMPGYDFTLETSVAERMKELRVARNMVALERQRKLDQINEERKRQAEELSQEQEEVIEATTSGGLLIPTQVNANNYTNILMPIPLTSRVEAKPNDKSPINISDFEPDTCSPFDNVELNTINDMEELRLVLQNDGKRTNLTQPNYQAQLTYPQTNEPQVNYYGYAAHSSNQIYPTYTGGNGYNYSLSESLHPKINSINHYAVYDYNSSKEYSSSFDVQTPQVNVDLNKEPFRSVPDIMRALQTELNNTHINNKDNSSLPSHSTKTNVNSNITTEDNLDNPFEHLPKKSQDICRVISTMGFPLSRVARACKDIGDDEKRVVEHLLAMSQLLDLGFSEKQVSTALLECNHDRDKALESLIS